MKLLILAALFDFYYAKHEKYDGWKSYFIGPTTAGEVATLHELADILELDFLSPLHSAREGVVLVQPQYQGEFIEILDYMRIKYRIHAENVKIKLDADDINIKTWRRHLIARHSKALPYNNYQRLDVIYDYMAGVAAKYRNITTLVTAGKTFEGRPIKYLKISTTNFRDKRKPVIVIDGGIHAREWIAPPIVTWAIKKLTEDVSERNLRNDFDWILMPVVNPDGYEYSFTTDRFWRKNRSKNTHIKESVCIGIDGNRNFDYLWNSVGASQDPCNDTYSGTHAFSEPESRVIRDILQEYRSRIAVYFTMHSYGSMVLYPWGQDKHPRNSFDLHSVGTAMVTAINKMTLPHFPKYIVGRGFLLLSYPTSGSSRDYAYNIGVPFCFVYELPGISSTSGFHLEPRYIKHVCQETWVGIAEGVAKAWQLQSRL